MNVRDEFELNAEDMLSDICADLLGRKGHDVFLERLFHIDPGKWYPLGELCKDIADIEARLNHPDLINRTAWATWLAYPGTLPDDQLCLVAFFSEDPDWRSFAVYNKDLFFRR
jgi:hypothetical protein